MIAKTKAKDVDDYISRFPIETQETLGRVRQAIRKLAPDAEEAISYGMPVFKQNGRYLIYFAAYAKHVSLYPAPRGKEPFREELANYKGGKGTVQFPLNAPLPMGLINRIIKYRIRENAIERK